MPGAIAVPAMSCMTLQEGRSATSDPRLQVMFSEKSMVRVVPYRVEEDSVALTHEPMYDHQALEGRLQCQIPRQVWH